MDSYVTYTVVSEKDLSEVEEQVNNLAKAGWRPHGSLVVKDPGPAEEHFFYFQPMTKLIVK